MMMRGRLGDATQFLTGAESWKSPETALTAAEGIFTSPSTAFSSANLWNTLGLLAVPAVLLYFVIGKK